MSRICGVSESGLAASAETYPNGFDLVPFNFGEAFIPVPFVPRE